MGANEKVKVLVVVVVVVYLEGDEGRTSRQV